MDVKYFCQKLATFSVISLCLLKININFVLKVNNMLSYSVLIQCNPLISRSIRKRNLGWYKKMLMKKGEVCYFFIWSSWASLQTILPDVESPRCCVCNIILMTKKGWKNFWKKLNFFGSYLEFWPKLDVNQWF